MDKFELERRTKRFAVNVVRFVEKLPKGKPMDVLDYQVLRSGTSVGANYREANRAQSRADFIAKIAIAEKESAETEYWLELLEELGFGDEKERNALLREARELLAIFVSIGRTTKANSAKNAVTKLRAPKSLNP